MTTPPSMNRPGSPTEPGLVERLIIDVLDTFHDGQREKKARAIAAALREAAALRSPLPDREGKEKQEVSPSVAESAAAPQEVCPAGAGPSGWRDISTAPKDGTSVLVGRSTNGAVFSAYWQDDGGNGPGWADGSTDNYEDICVFDGLTHWMPLPPPPVDHSLSGSQGTEGNTSTEWQLRDDLNSTSIPSGGDALKEALSKRSFVLSGPHLSGWTLTLGFEHRDDVNAAHEAVARLALSPPQSSRGTGERTPPEPPWPVGARTNAMRVGWTRFFTGYAREACPFPDSRNDLRKGYETGWDTAKASPSPTPLEQPLPDDGGRK